MDAHEKFCDADKLKRDAEHVQNQSSMALISNSVVVLKDNINDKFDRFNEKLVGVQASMNRLVIAGMVFVVSQLLTVIGFLVSHYVTKG